MRHTDSVKTVKEKKKGIKRLGAVLKWCGTVFLLCVIAACLGIGVLFATVDVDRVDLDKIRQTRQTALFYDDEERLISGMYSLENRIDVELSMVPQHVINAFIAIEDVRFFEHQGVDLRRIVGSLLQDLEAGAYVEGGSTITQQLIKLTHLTSEKTISRKINEAILAIKLERLCTKNEILEMYLNYVYFGNGAYGVEAASRTFFGKHVDEISLDEAAVLAAVINSPAEYSPYYHYEKSIARRDLVLSQMLKYGMISYEEYETARAAKTGIRTRDEQDAAGAYYIDAAMEEACETLGIEKTELLTGGYRIYTCMNKDLQARCEELLWSEEYFKGAGNRAEAAFILTDTVTGAVKAIVGGRHYHEDGGWNRATKAKRQPGSAIKPILVYGPALEYGLISPATPIKDEEIDINGYAPKNFNKKYIGWTTARAALASSLNCPAVKLLHEVGIERAKAYASAAGIDFDENDNHLALALGGMAYGTTPEELCLAYRTIAGGGYRVENSFVKRIEKSDGSIMYISEPKRERKLSPEGTYLLTDMLRSTVSIGTAKTLAGLNIDIAAKTGTVDAVNGTGNKDVWIAAYTTEYTAVLWCGFDKQTENLPVSFSGGNIPAQIMKEVFSLLYRDRKPAAFSEPDGVVRVKLDKQTLEEEHELALASMTTPPEYTLTEVFARGKEPTRITSYWDPPQTQNDITVTVDGEGYPVISFLSLQRHVIYRIVRVEPDERETVVKEFCVETGDLISYTDQTVAPNTIYAYYVIPLHSKLRVDGAFLRGQPSDKRIVMSGAGNALTLPERTEEPQQILPPIFGDFFGND